MILFVGCSYTWGSGLQYEYLYDKGWSVDKLNKDMYRIISKDSIDPLDYKADEYRKQYSWPNLVAKKLNKPYMVGTTKSASNLDQILKSIKHAKNLCHSSKSNQIDTIVVQFTDWLRDASKTKFGAEFHKYFKKSEYGDRPYTKYKDDDLVEDYLNIAIHSHIKKIADACDEIRNEKSIRNHSYSNSYPSWVGLSWKEDLGNILKDKYSKNFIPIFHNDNEYVSFDKIQVDNNLLLKDTIGGLNDSHFNSKGCEVISNSIIRKLEQ